jgi:hypothetical protein
MARPKSDTERIWEGDQSVIEEAWKRFDENPEKELLPFASVLYSFRSREHARWYLIGIRDILLKRAKSLVAKIVDAGELEAQQCADEADVLSTVLLWLSEKKSVPHVERTHILNAVLQTSTWGVQLMFKGTISFHTQCLLHLTLAQARIADRQRFDPGSLSFVEMLQEKIDNPNQRARVLRKLGMIYRSQARYLGGLRWGIRACLVPGSTRAVRMKSVVALVGFDI